MDGRGVAVRGLGAGQSSGAGHRGGGGGGGGLGSALIWARKCLPLSLSRAVFCPVNKGWGLGALLWAGMGVCMWVAPWGSAADFPPPHRSFPVTLPALFISLPC